MNVKTVGAEHPFLASKQTSGGIITLFFYLFDVSHEILQNISHKKTVKCLLKLHFIYQDSESGFNEKYESLTQNKVFFINPHIKSPILFLFLYVF
jgi:hypothetical protein